MNDPRRLALLWLVPPAALVTLVTLYGVDAPVLDEFELLGRIARVRDGGALGDELMRPHHEHWMPVPLLLIFGYARWTDWNIGAELVGNVVLGLGILAVYLVEARRAAAADERRWWGTMPVVSLLACSITQHANWLCGMQLASWLALLGTLCATSLLCARGSAVLRFPLAVLCALVASASQFQGNLAWPVGAMCLALVRGVRGRGRALLVVWSLVGAVVLWFAWRRLEPTVVAEAAGAGPAGAIAFVLAYLGGPLMTHSDVGAVVAGAAGLFGAVVLVARRGPARCAFPAALVVFSVGAATITAIGRLDLGLETARASRYVPYATPLWIALVSLHGAAATPRAWRVVVVGAIAAACCFSAALSWGDARRQGAARAAARAHILSRRDRVPPDLTAFTPLYTDPELLALLHESEAEDLSAFQLQNADAVERILRRHGLAFVEPQQARVLRADLHLVLRALVTLKRHRLSLFRDAAR